MNMLLLPMSEPNLHCAHVIAGYQGSTVLRDISFTFLCGSILTILGPNGAGKSTVLKAIMNLCEVMEGEIQWQGSSILGHATDELLRAGIAFVPQGRINFPSLTIFENLRMGGFILPRADLEERIAEAFRRFPILKERQHATASSLSGGESQMLAIARALMVRPQLLLLDEPSLGLSPMVTRELFTTFRDLASHGTGIILVEQNVRPALAIADEAMVLVAGKIAWQGTAGTLGTEKLRELFLQ